MVLTHPEAAEAVRKPEYTHKSFELVFAAFCKQYADRIEALSGHDHSHFLGLPPNASAQQMGKRLAEISQLMGEQPTLDDEELDSLDLKEAVLLSARYLAYFSISGSLTQQYADRLKDFKERERTSHSANGGSRHNLSRLAADRETAINRLLAQNHALRDFFDSRLAHTLGNDSPEHMDKLLRHNPYLTTDQREGLVKGISLEIAAKQRLEAGIAADGYEDLSVAYGTDQQDAKGGDLVLLAGEDILFIDLKSHMPKVFSDGDRSTEADYERGYKMLELDGEERKAVCWAYSDSPVAETEFRLTDPRLISSLDLLAGSVYV